MHVGKVMFRAALAAFVLTAVAGLPVARISEAGINPASVRYKIDAGPSKFIVRAFTGGFLKAFGHDHTIAIRDFAGDVTLTEGSITPASLQLTIKAASLAVIDKVSDSDRQKIEGTMRQEVLEADQYPEIVFRSTNTAAARRSDGRYDFKVWGNLSMHGVTGECYIIGQMEINGNNLRATGSFALQQSDYKIKPVSVAGGTIKVKDELKLTFDLVAHKQ
jgi:polyisoprenoid-binding protein YceI